MTIRPREGSIRIRGRERARHSFSCRRVQRRWRWIRRRKITVQQVVSAVDAGKAVNPRQCDLQNEGSMIMSLGSALFEEMVFDNGQPINSTFLEYMPASMEDHPQKFRSLLVETPHPEGPFGAKGVGEAGLGPVEPAIGNAVANALGGIRFKDLPLRPDRVLAAVRSVRGEGA